MKKVLLLLPGAFSGVGGIEMYNRQLIRAFLEIGLERGFAVKTFVLNDDPEDVDERYLPDGAGRPLGLRRRKAAFAVEAIRSVFEERPELIVFGHVHFARFGRLLKRLCPTSRHWYFAYGIEVWHPLSKAIRRGLAEAERVLSISDFSRKELAKNGGVPESRIALLPCALDAVWQEHHVGGVVDSSPGAATILTVARLAAAEGYKGVDTVIRALREVRRSVPAVVYEVVGDGDDRPRLEELARQEGVADAVRFLGRLDADALAAAYARCSLFAMPSEKEGFGIVFLEAAFFGKPSIGGRHGGTPEVIEDGVTGYLVSRGDVAGLTDVAVRLLVDSNLRGAMGEAARVAVRQRFSYTVFRRSLARALCGNAGAGPPAPERAAPRAAGLFDAGGPARRGVGA